MAPALFIPRHPDLTPRRERTLAELARSAAVVGAARSTLDLALEIVRDDLEVDATGYWHETGAGHLRLVAWSGRPGPMADTDDPVTPDSQAAYVLASDRAVCVHQPTETRFTASRMIGDLGFVRTLGVRVRRDGRPVGLLGAYSRAERPFSSADTEFVEAIARLVASSLTDEALFDASLDPDRDPLTGLLSAF